MSDQNKPTHSLSYRPDIDGLRALAVLLVVLYHLGTPYINGGYVGVDVFFVISGFLITSILVKDYEQGSFSLARFYERRIKRILPALFVVLLACTLASYFILFPEEFKYFGQGLAATSVFGSNILFWKESGYFEVEATLVPLLHTWSLGVEEQFYIFFPLLIVFIFKFFHRWRVHLIAMLLLLSFVISVVALQFGKYSATFYLLPPRAWELLIGSVLALSILPGLKTKRICNVLCFLGLGLILYAGFFFDEETLFPGANALFPTIGAALLIYAGAQSQGLVSRALSGAVPVFIGKISYSLYLWHWPVIVFYKYASPVEINAVSGSALFIVSIILASLSWQYVEQPARKNLTLPRFKVFLLAAIGSLLFLSAGMSIYKYNGLPQRFPEDVQKLAKAKIGLRLPTEKMKGFDEEVAILGDPDKEASFIIWGDSHAKASAPALHDLALKAGKKGYLFEDPGCMPSHADISIFEEACNRFNEAVWKFLQAHPEIKQVTLISYWSAYARRMHKHAKKGTLNVSDPFYYYMNGVFQELQAQSKSIHFVIEVPRVSVEQVPLYLARAKYYGQEVHLETSLNKHVKVQKAVYQTLETLEREYKFSVLYPHKALCGESVCSVTHEGRSLYYDDDHLSQYGARHIKSAYEPLFR